MNHKAFSLRIALTAFLSALSLFHLTVSAENYPTRNIRLIVPFPAGGTTDVEARMIASVMSKELNGATVVTENIPGAATVSAALEVLRDKPDGHAIILASDTTLNINQWTFKKPPYSVADLKPVTILHDFVHWLAVPANSPHQTLDAFKRHIKNNPGKVSIAVNNHGGSAYLALDAWKRANDFDFEIIPYKGGTESTNALVGGHIDAQVNVVGASSLPYARSGQIRPLAVLHAEPLSEFPAVVTQDPSNAQDFVVQSYLTLAVHANTPDATVEKLYRVMQSGAKHDAFTNLMQTLNIQPLISDPSSSQKHVDEQTARYEQLIANAGIQKQ